MNGWFIAGGIIYVLITLFISRRDVRAWWARRPWIRPDW